MTKACCAHGVPWFRGCFACQPSADDYTWDRYLLEQSLLEEGGLPMRAPHQPEEMPVGEEIQLGDVITLNNVPAIGWVRWRVVDWGGRRPDRDGGARLLWRLEPLGPSPAFNRVACEYWIIQRRESAATGYGEYWRDTP